MLEYCQHGFWKELLRKVLNNSIQIDLMLKRYGKSRGKSVTLWFEDKPVQAVEGESVAAALLTSGVKYLRHSLVSAKPRTPYCWMGSCFECLLEIDGEQNQQSCLITVRDGMRIFRHSSATEKT